MLYEKKKVLKKNWNMLKEINILEFFDDQNELESENKDKLDKINYMLLENFKNKYINELYSHLFFGRLCVEYEKFDKCLPEIMNWIQIIRECLYQLKNELSKIGIKYFEIFMNYSFKDLFEKLNESEPLDTYEKLVKFEDEYLEPLIKRIIEKTQNEINKCNDDKDKNNGINLLKEIYPPQN